MRKMKKLLSVLLAATMTLAMAAPSFAADPQTVSAGAGPAEITINNASKDEDYAVYKLFDATVTGETKGSIAYTSEEDIPEGLTEYFVKDSVGNISSTDKAGSEEEASEGLRNALAEWIEGVTPTLRAKSNGSVLKFVGLAYGYYVVTTSQGEQAITVTSTNPNASIYDKNNTEPSLPEDGVMKKLVDEDGNAIDDKSVTIGDTVIYSVTFNTTNYIGAGEDAKQVLNYKIHDTLPEFLTNVYVKEITIDSGEDEVNYKVNGETPQFDDKKEIIIPWVNDGVSKYNNEAPIVITYSAVVMGSNTIVIDGDGNKNEVTATWETSDGWSNEGDDPKSLTGSETIYTYALAIKKVDAAHQPLAGAKFSIDGVKVTKEAKGVYIVAPNGSIEEMECDDNGLLVVKGLDDTAKGYTVTEVEAPAGYNKLKDAITVKVQKISETVTTTTTYYDEEGNVVDTEQNSETTVTTTNDALVAAAQEVVNNTGAQLPSTGGIGTTIFYAAGIILMAGAVFFVVRRKRA